MTPVEGTLVRLRAVEPADIDAMYRWENDPAVWRVSGTLTPFSRHQLARFVEEQQFDLFQTRQQRLIIERLTDGAAIGTFDLFEIDPLNGRAGLGLLIYPAEARGQGCATDALGIVCRYARDVLRLHQLWGNAGAANAASRALLCSAGFREVGVKRDWNWSPEGYTDEIFYQKILE